ncbi:hypothetical protein GCM10025795_31140 [Verticiella sediminum]
MSGADILFVKPDFGGAAGAVPGSRRERSARMHRGSRSAAAEHGTLSTQQDAIVGSDALRAARSSGADAVAPHRWLLRKNCSLSPRQVALFYLSLTLLSFAFAAYFSWRGLWLVWPFALAENLLLACALLYYARHALDRECVCLDGDALTVDVVRGAVVTRHAFNAAWARLEWRGRRGDVLWLCEGRRAMPLGLWVAPPARRAFARELRQALRQRSAR